MTKAMTKREARDYVENEIDEKFMEDVGLETMTPEKAQKKIEEMQKDIVKFQDRAEEIEKIANLAGNEGFNILISEFQMLINKGVSDLDPKNIKDSTKILEAGLLISDKIKLIKSEYDDKLRAINAFENAIEQIKTMGFQQSLLEEGLKA